MENRLRPDTQVESKLASDFESLADPSKRTFLRAAGLLIAGLMAPQARAHQSLHGAADTGHKVVVVIIGGVRQAETFSPEGLGNIPHLSADLLPKALFYPRARNEGVTAHFNAISSILTGNWQRVDDWASLPRPLRPCSSNFASGSASIGVRPGLWPAIRRSPA